MPDQVAIITGASKGIGRQTALGFAAAGYHVALCGTSGEALKDLATEIQNRHQRETLICQGDLSDINYTLSISKKVLEKNGTVSMYW